MRTHGRHLHVAEVGTGYVGLVTATGLADIGFPVSAGDIDGVVVARLHLGERIIHEPGLGEVHGLTVVGVGQGGATRAVSLGAAPQRRRLAGVQ